MINESRTATVIHWQKVHNIGRHWSMQGNEKSKDDKEKIMAPESVCLMCWFRVVELQTSRTIHINTSHMMAGQTWYLACIRRIHLLHARVASQCRIKERYLTITTIKRSYKPCQSSPRVKLGTVEAIQRLKKCTVLKWSSGDKSMASARTSTMKLESLAHWSWSAINHGSWTCRPNDNVQWSKIQQWNQRSLIEKIGLAFPFSIMSRGHGLLLSPGILCTPCHSACYRCSWFTYNSL